LVESTLEDSFREELLEAAVSVEMLVAARFPTTATTYLMGVVQITLHWIESWLAVLSPVVGACIGGLAFFADSNSSVVGSDVDLAGIFVIFTLLQSSFEVTFCVG